MTKPDRDDDYLPKAKISKYLPRIGDARGSPRCIEHQINILSLLVTIFQLQVPLISVIRSAKAGHVARMLEA